MMDEVAFITATRFTRKRCVTVSSDKIDFTKPIPAGTITTYRQCNLYWETA
jgi:acyl-CoA hydrolase